MWLAAGDLVVSALNEFCFVAFCELPDKKGPIRAAMAASILRSLQFLIVTKDTFIKEIRSLCIHHRIPCGLSG